MFLGGEQAEPTAGVGFSSDVQRLLAATPQEESQYFVDALDFLMLESPDPEAQATHMAARDAFQSGSAWEDIPQAVQTYILGIASVADEDATSFGNEWNLFMTRTARVRAGNAAQPPAAAAVPGATPTVVPGATPVDEFAPVALPWRFILRFDFAGSYPAQHGGHISDNSIPIDAAVEGDTGNPYADSSPAEGEASSAYAFGGMVTLGAEVVLREWGHRRHAWTLPAGLTFNITGVQDDEIPTVSEYSDSSDETYTANIYYFGVETGIGYRLWANNGVTFAAHFLLGAGYTWSYGGEEDRVRDGYLGWIELGGFDVELGARIALGWMSRRTGVGFEFFIGDRFNLVPYKGGNWDDSTNTSGSGHYVLPLINNLNFGLALFFRRGDGDNVGESQHGY